MPTLRPYSRDKLIRSIDGRSPEGRSLQQTRKALLKQVGGKPSAAQKMMIDRIAVLTLHLSKLDEKMLADGMTGHDSRQYLSWANTQNRLLRQLGTHAKPEAPKSLADHKAERAQGRAA